MILQIHPTDSRVFLTLLMKSRSTDEANNILCLSSTALSTIAFATFKEIFSWFDNALTVLNLLPSSTLSKYR